MSSIILNSKNICIHFQTLYLHSIHFHIHGRIKTGKPYTYIILDYINNGTTTGKPDTAECFT